MLVSVIIPIYNTEPYLHQCVDSVLNQRFHDLEIILVDDGSTDNSPQICDAYAKKDKRICVIHKPNGGLSDARNAGVKIAKGEYALFLDSDDFWIDRDAVKKLAARQTIKASDVLSFSYHKLDENTGKIGKMNLSGPDMPTAYFSKRDQFSHLFSNDLFISSACNKLISIELLKKLPFEKGKFSEDVEWTCRLMKMAQSFDYINEDFYCYRQRAGSIAHTISEKNCTDLKDAILKCWEMLVPCDPEIERFLETYTAYQLSTFIAVQSFTEHFQEKSIEELRKVTPVLSHFGRNRKVQCMYYGVKGMGLKKWCRFIRATKTIWDKHRDIV